MKFLFVMDPVETLNLETETSLLLMEELLKRGQGVYWTHLDELSLVQGKPTGRVFRVACAEPLGLSMSDYTDLNEFDAVLVRIDPPVDNRYLHMTLVLDYLDPSIVQFNDVRALRNFNEKLLPLRWPEFTPPTLVSMDKDQLADFAIEHGHIILKPLNNCSGRGIVKIDRDKNGIFRESIGQALLESDGSSRFLVAQKYLPSVQQGDKRVFLVNGEVVGMVNRIPADGGYLANIHQGAVCEPAQLSSREKHIVRRIAPFLVENGIFMAGADFIGGYLTELNITSPSAIRQINAVNGDQVQEKIVGAMLERMVSTNCCRCCTKAA